MLLGGVLTGPLNWHWIFLVNVPDRRRRRALLSLRLLPAAPWQAAGGRLDVAGAVRSRASLMLAVYAVVGGNEAGWTVRADARPARRSRSCCWRCSWSSRPASRSPLVPLRLFKLRNVAVANVVGVLWAAAMFAWFFLSALYLQQVLGYSPLEVGLAFLPASLIMGAFSLGAVGQAGDALRDQASAGNRPVARRGRARALRPGSGRRQLRRRCPARA